MRPHAFLPLLLAACAAPSPPAPEPTAIVVGPVVAPSATAPVVTASPAIEAPPPPNVTGLPLPKAFWRALSSSIPPSSDADALTFRDATAREEAGDLAGARKGYYDVIARSPQSPLVPYAYLGFGDMFMDEADADATKLPLAQQAYQKVVTYPPPGNLAYAYAWERLAEVDARSNDFPHALDADRKAIAASAASASLPAGDVVAEAARGGLVSAYASSGDPIAAFSFFQSTDAANASALVVRLGQEYVRLGKATELEALYESALATRNDAICAGAADAAKSFHATTRLETALVKKLESKRRRACGP